jgi:hypothetical protein
MRVLNAPVALLALAAPLVVAADKPSTKPQRPVLTLRAKPGAAMPPVNVLFVAELQGGDEVEDLYCPEIHWDFDNGRRSSSQSDCDPFDETSILERRFLVRQKYMVPGEYTAILTLRRAGVVVAQAAATVSVVSPGTDGGGAFAAARR